MMKSLKCSPRVWILGAGLVAAASLLAADPAPEKPALQIVADKADRPIAFEATGLPNDKLAKLAAGDDASDAFARLLSVSVVEGKEKPDLPAMAGTYSVSGSSLRFTPRFALRPGLRYRATLRPESAGTKPITLEVTVPEAAAGKPTEITHVYPTAATLPENQLKFYIHFSAPKRTNICICSMPKGSLPTCRFSNCPKNCGTPAPGG
jgi:hypothetical protein